MKLKRQTSNIGTSHNITREHVSQHCHGCKTKCHDMTMRSISVHLRLVIMVTSIFSVVTVKIFFFVMAAGMAVLFQVYFPAKRTCMLDVTVCIGPSLCFVTGVWA